MPGTTSLIATSLPQQRAGSEFDLDGFLEVMRNKDPDAWSDYFAPDAEWLEYRHHEPPHDPRRLEGNVSIHQFLCEICADERHMHVEDLVAGPESIWFRRMVRMADDRMEIEHVHLHIDNGVITREIDVDSWDYA